MVTEDLRNGRLMALTRLKRGEQRGLGERLADPQTNEDQDGTE